MNGNIVDLNQRIDNFIKCKWPNTPLKSRDYLNEKRDN